LLDQVFLFVGVSKRFYTQLEKRHTIDLYQLRV